MDEQLDNDLKNRIREVFEHYDEPSADKGWQQLRKKFPEPRKNRRLILWYWTGVAAMLFLFLGIGFWINNERMKPGKITYKKPGNQLHKDLIADKEQPDSIRKTNTRGGNISSKITANPLFAVSPPSAKAAEEKLKNPGRRTTGIKSPLFMPDTGTNKSFFAKNATNTDSTRIAVNKIPAQKPSVNLPAKTFTGNKDEVITKPRAKSINTMFADDPGIKTKADTEKIKKIRFSIYEATYFNYAKGSDNNVNVGIGFTTDIKISKNLKLVTGLAVAQNSLNFNGNLANISQNNFPAAALANTSTYLAAGPSYYGLNGFSPATSVKDYSASLVGLDIPVNLKYEFNPQKNNFYFSAGFSSGTFINETYNLQYNYVASSAQFSQQTQSESTNKSFSSFYFAKTLNLTFGAGLPFGKNRVFIEPFLKYPIGGLGYQDIRFGAGGINLKFNFQSAK